MCFQRKIGTYEKKENDRYRYILPQARAIENQIYFCACNQTGEALCGNTKVISYDGTVLKSLDKEEGILTVDIDLQKQEEYRKEFPVLKQISI